MRDIVAKYGPGGFRTERSLFVKVAEAKNIGEEKDTYCIIVVDGVHKARTPTVFKSNAPLFSQEYDMDLDSEAEILTVQLRLHTKKKESDLVGQTSIRFSELAAGNVIEKWFTLTSSTSDSVASTGSGSSLNIPTVGSGIANASGALASGSESAGEIRLALQYSSVTVLADDSYDHLFRLLLKDKMAATILLSQASAKKEKVVADCLVKAFEARKTGAHYIKTIIQSEIENTPNPNIIFRGNTVGTKSVDTYMRLVGLPYLSTVLGPVITEIYQGKKSCELDTQRINGSSKEKTAEKNLVNLLSYCKRIFEAISTSFNRCPAAFRNIFEYIQEVVVKRFPDDEVIRYTAPGGFIFLRFFCPAILNPKLFNLANDHPTENVNRDLTLIAKTIQNLANLVPFGQKEPYMEGVNSFIIEYTPQMKVFLDTLCSPPKEAIDEISSKVSLNFGREVARIHAYMAAAIPIMTDNIKNKGDQPEQLAILEEIKAVINNLNQDLLNGPSGNTVRPSTPQLPIKSASSANVVANSATPPSTAPNASNPMQASAPQTAFAATGPAPEETANGQAEALLLKRKLHHLQFIQEQQAKLLELEKALTAAQAQ